jgi:hypothetical protein
MLVRRIGGRRGWSVFWVLQTLSVAAWAGYGGGSGTPEDPYLIFTAEQLDAAGTQPGDWDKHFRLMADIDLGRYRGAEFHRMGTPEDGPFTGVFDGNCRTVSNFHWSTDWTRYLGLFGFVDGENARIANVTLLDPNITIETGQYTGALVGFIRGGTVTNCHVRRGVVSGENCIGGLIGAKEVATVTDCTASATVRGINRVGGLVGHSFWGLTSRCEAAGVVTGDMQSEGWGVGGLIGQSQYGIVTDCHANCTVQGNRYIGGLIGLNPSAGLSRSWADGAVHGTQYVGGLLGRNEGGSISDCYALAAASGTLYIGGLAGCNAPNCQCSTHINGLITRCYAAGPVAGQSDGGGLIGFNDKSDSERSFWDMQASGCLTSAGGAPMTTAQMQDPSIYTAAGWDFVGEKQNGTEEVWCMSGSTGYPRLAWHAATGDLDADGDVDFRDFGRLAGQWRQTDTGFWSRGAWLAADGLIDFDDLAALAQTWLAGGR